MFLLVLFNKEKRKKMLDIKSDDFLGGNNVHNVIIIGLLGYLVYKSYKG